MHSSQCIWTEATNPKRLLESLEPVRKYTYISSDSFTPPQVRASKAALKVEGAVGQAEFAISIPRNDSHDRFLIKNNKLYCFLSPESFSTFGLDAKKISSPNLREHHYLAIYELDVPGKRLNRLKWAFENTMNDIHDFWLIRKPGISGPSDIPDGETRCISRSATVGVPNLNAPIDPDEFADWSNFLTEWIGLCYLNPLLLSAQSNVDPSLCAFDQYNDVRYAQVAISHQSGLFTTQDIASIWSQTDSAEWAVLHVQGFDSVPVAWNRDSVHKCGELGYTLIKCRDKVHCFKYV